MNKKIAFPSLCFFLIFGNALCSLQLKYISATPSVSGKTVILYDAAAGAIPAAPLMNFTDFPPGSAPPTYIDGMAVLDTTTSGDNTYAGWISNGTATPGFPVLDRTAGFQLDFALQVGSESHTNNNRAGFSIIILSEDARGIELAFWEKEIWAQNDDTTGGFFTHGEGATFATTTDLINYQVIVDNDTYTLTANTERVLTGPLRNYSTFEGFPDPYETPNLLFLGDDTTSAQARIRLGFVSVTGTERTIPATSSSSSSITPSVSITPGSSQTSAIKKFASCKRWTATNRCSRTAVII
jgi:hypothetical protein